jgi:hypothetical protein
MAHHPRSARTESLLAYFWAAIFLAITPNTIEAFTDVHGWWWRALRMTVSGVFIGIAVALAISWWRDRRAA